ncbi:MAG: hypothetical protein JW876_08100 [Candidatus Krumholzibacteriota bacterium]|nr:hypothetical protein [Candidatus Krumholzibacteriota bacterium]
MRRLICIAIALAVAAPALAAATAGADSATTAAALDSAETAAVDSAMAAAVDTTGIDRVRPSWSSKMEGSETYLSLGSSVNVVIDAGHGWMLGHATSITKKTYRGRDQDEINEQMMNTAGKIVPGLLTLNLKIGETYLSKTLTGLARYGQGLVVQNEQASIDATVTRPFLFSRKGQISVRAEASRGQNDFKYDERIFGGVGGYLWYDLGDRVTLDGGFGTSRGNESSEITEQVAWRGLPSDADTVRASFDYGIGDKKSFSLTYRRSVGTVRKVTPPRGNSLEILDDPTAAVEEEERRKAELFSLASEVSPFDFLTIEFEFEHEINDQKNKVDTRLSKEIEETFAKATVSWRYARRGNLSVTMENGIATYFYGTTSLSNYEGKNKKIGFGLTHAITDSLKVSLRGSTSLRQKYIEKKAANPRDRDDVYEGLVARLESSPFGSLKADVEFSMDRRETINIDASLSGDNRVDWLYRFVPRLSMTPFPWLRLSQEYQLKWESTEFTYFENNNDLDRTMTVETDAGIRFTRPLGLSFRHKFNFRDSGNYVRYDDGVRRYNRNAENTENSLWLKMDYRPRDGYIFRAEANFRYQENSRLRTVSGRSVVTSTSIYDTGGMRIGFDRSRTVFGGGKLELAVDYVRRFGPNLTAERKEFWDIDANVSFAF